jgi:hypothetical protein
MAVERRMPNRLLILTLIASQAGVAAAVDLRFTGIARDLQTRQLLYVESHHVHDAGKPGEQRVVLYRCAPDGPAFARKELTYGASRAAPEFNFLDARDGYLEGLQRSAKGLRVVHKPNALGVQREAVVPAGGELVADAGFDEFVRARWNELEKGQTVRFPFLVPSRLDVLSFKIRKHHETVIDGAPASVIRLALSGVIGWFLPHIDVSYRKSDRVLLRYEGLTNVRDAKGENHIAVIDFPNVERRETKVDLAAARGEPLIARCPAPRAS